MAAGQATGPLASLRRVVTDARALGPRELAGAVVEGFGQQGLLIEAGAIAFRVFLAVITAALCVLGVLSFLGLGELYAREVVPPLRASVSPAAFQLIDGAVTQVLREQELFWVTAGAALAIWEISAVVRATGQILNRMYRPRAQRSLLRELAETMAAGAAVALLWLGALAAVRLGGPAIDSLLGTGWLAQAISFLVRWGVAVTLLLATVTIMARVGLERPLRWVTFGSLVAVLGWIGMSLLFRLYVTEVASFNSVFGGLATAFIFAEYLLLSAVVLLAGLLIDAIVEERT